jgi:regulatory helix-turn-helix LysR family protein
VASDLVAYIIGYYVSREQMYAGRISLDQLSTFIAAVDEGSFSAAGRRLARAQSVISQAVANLEEQIGVKLVDCSALFPVLTDPGRALAPGQLGNVIASRMRVATGSGV